MTTDEVDQIVREAHDAYEVARDVTPTTRATWLEAIASALDADADALVELAHQETSLPVGRLRGELTRSTFQLQLFADELRRGEPLDAVIDHTDERWGMGPRPDIRRVNVPLGVVTVFGASNFPFAFSVMGGDTASALAAGCAVVHKIHEAHLKLGLRTAKVATDALSRVGAPAGIFATVQDRAEGEALVDHPHIKAVSFTGSTRVGRILMRRAAARPEPIPFYGELGSINPVFVTQAAWQARREEIIAGYVASFTLGAGQFCTKPGLLFVPALDNDDVATISAAVSEAPTAPMLTPQLARAFEDARNAVASRAGLSVLVPGGTGHAPAPALLRTSAEAIEQNPGILREELFGPASIVVEYTDEGKLPHLARLLEGQLTTAIQGTETDEVGDLVNVLESRSGRVIWNAWPTGVTVTYAQQHGGPFPATTAPDTTSVGTSAVRRFMRPVAYQGMPADGLPPSLWDENPWGIARRVDGNWDLGR